MTSTTEYHKFRGSSGVSFTIWAEQDNRVRSPNGTAAVCAEGSFFGESQSLEKSGKAKEFAKLQSFRCMSQKTYGI